MINFMKYKKIKLKVPETKNDLKSFIGISEAPAKEIGAPSLIWQVCYKTSLDSAIYTQMTKASSADHAVSVARSYIPRGAEIVGVHQVPSRINLAYAGYLDEQNMTISNKKGEREPKYAKR